MSTKETGTVRLCVDVSEELRIRLRYAALGERRTLREYVIRLIEEGLGKPDDGCTRCGSFSHAARECSDSGERR